MKRIKNKLKIIFSILLTVTLIIGIYINPKKEVQAEENCTTEETIPNVAYIEVPNELIVKQYDAGYLNIKNNSGIYWLYKFSAKDGSGSRPYKNGAGANNYDQARYNNWTYKKESGWYNTSNPYVINKTFPFTYNIAEGYKMTNLTSGRIDSLTEFYKATCGNNGIGTSTNLVSLKGTTSANDAGICNLSEAEFKSCVLTNGEDFLNKVTDNLSSNSFVLNSTTVRNIPKNTSLCSTKLNTGEAVKVIFLPAQYTFTLKPSGTKEVKYTFEWKKEEGKEVTGAYIDYFKGDNDYSKYKSMNDDWVPTDFKNYSLLENEDSISWDSKNKENVFDKEDIKYNKKTGMYSVTVRVTVNLDKIVDNKGSYYDNEHGNVFFVPINLKVQYSGCTSCDKVKTNAPRCCNNADYFEYINSYTHEQPNIEQCCKLEKSNRASGGENWKFYPISLEKDYEKNCGKSNDCKTKSYFNSNKSFCCDTAKKSKNFQDYIPDEYNYNNVCPTGGGSSAESCKKEGYFASNTAECCKLEKSDGKKGNYLPKGKTYSKACPPEKEDKCQTELDIKKSPITCCDGKLENGEATGKLYTDNCLIKNAPKTCNNTSFNKTISDTRTDIEVEETIEFINYDSKNKIGNIESGRGFEYPITIKDTITITPEYPNKTNASGKDEAEELLKKYKRVNDAYDTALQNINKNIENKFRNQEIKFNIKSESIQMIIGEDYNKENNKLIEKSNGSVDIEYEHCIESDCEDISVGTVDTYKSTTTTIIYQVILPRAYINKSTGKVLYDKPNDSVIKDYLDGGNKYYTNENLITQTYNFNITMTQGGASEKVKISDTHFTCSVNTYNCIKDGTCVANKEADPVEGKEYYFRPISLTDPFPNEREAGSNWGGNDTKLRSEWIWKNKTNPESTDKTKADSVYGKDPMYKITLTSDLITKIKEYNKNSNYLEWNMTNKSGSESISKFLSGEGEFDFMKDKVEFYSTKRIEKYGEARVVSE